MNKGEWSEFYTFLRLLGDGKLYAADSNLNKIEDLYYPIIKIIRKSQIHKEFLFYEISDKNVIIVSSESANELNIISSQLFSVKANKLLKLIKNSDSNIIDGEIEEFTSKIESPFIKENSQSKRDITLVVHDINTGHKPEVGFSIKSKLGGASTLFNANISNNLDFKVIGLEHLSSSVINKLKSLKAKALLKALSENNCQINFERAVDSHFESNLQMIDSDFPVILAEMLRLYYAGYAVNVKDIVKKVSEINPCNFRNNDTFPFYEHKIKAFLTACALGMTSKRPWNGSFDVSGGYIIVKESGEVLCYHIYNWNDFQTYLLNNTFLDTPSTTRHRFGTLNGNMLKLNFQIRFN